MIRALLWKEWREQRGTLALGCFVMVGFVSVGLQARVVQDIHVLQLAQWLGSLVLPIIVAMGLVAPERRAGTLTMLHRLPTPAWLSFVIKLLMGALLLTGILLLTAATATMLAGNREFTSGEPLLVLVGALPTALMLMIWTTVLGIRLRSETLVGLCGLSLLLGCVLFETVLSSVFGVDYSTGPLGWFVSVLRYTGMNLLPWREGVPLSIFDPHHRRMILMEWSWLQLLLAASACAMGAWQYTRVERSRG